MKKIVLDSVFPVLALVSVVLCAASARAADPSAGQSKAAAPTVQALLVSDIHFEPFWDPAKTARLEKAPASEWDAILAAPDAANREARFNELQQTCHARGVDTSYTLYKSSLQAIEENASASKFVVVSGDLISHSFSCKFQTLAPHAKPGDYRAFVEKTIEYVLRELRAALPGVPVYAALGNNDSDCGDYQLDPNSAFLKTIAVSLAGDVHGPARAVALRDFAEGGYFTVRLPAPLEHTRLVVLDDVFMSRKYQTCGGKEDPAPAAAQIVWLDQQLDAVRRAHEKAWVMAHIPPGVDPYSTASKSADLCRGGKPQMFLKTEALAEAIAPYGDTIALAIFGHTHMDEMRFLKPTAQGSPPEVVAVKVSPSITPIDGNNPSFTIAHIDAATAGLKDYRVIVASNKTGVAAIWTEEYDFTHAYKEPAFDAAAAADLIKAFAADPTAQTDASRNYIKNYGTGGGLRALGVIWQPYVCALENDEADVFTKCVCQKQGVGSSQ